MQLTAFLKYFCVPFIFLSSCCSIGWGSRASNETEIKMSVQLSPQKARLTVPNCGVSKYSYHGDKIVGGRDAVRGEYPWQISLRSGGSHICGGSILNKNYILTAGHCVFGGELSRYTVLVGGHNLRSQSGSEVVHKVSHYRVHMRYSPITLEHDIALLKLSTPINLESNYVNGICLPTAGKDHENTVTVSGWGTTREGGSLPAVLQSVNVPVISHSRCQQLYGSQINTYVICAGLDNGGNDSCQVNAFFFCHEGNRDGDSSGPLVQKVNGKFELVGIVSWGIGCTRPKYPGVYTRVSRYIPWIEEYAQ